MATESVKVRTSAPAESDPIRQAQALARKNRREGLAALNALFRAGKVPDPPIDGPMEGELVAVDIAPGVSSLLEWLTSFMMPWKGKYLIAAQSKGDNLFGQNWRTVLHLMFPFYRGNRDYDHARFRAFIFDTSVAAGKVDPDRQVFRIDYDRPDNPRLTIRRIVDEVTQVREGLYLGKIHFQWWWGTWQMIGYFALRKRS
jgi:hypothetical protein